MHSYLPSCSGESIKKGHCNFAYSRNAMKDTNSSNTRNRKRAEVCHGMCL